MQGCSLSNSFTLCFLTNYPWYKNGKRSHWLYCILLRYLDLHYIYILQMNCFKQLVEELLNVNTNCFLCKNEYDSFLQCDAINKCILYFYYITKYYTNCSFTEFVLLWMMLIYLIPIDNMRCILCYIWMY